MQLPIASLQARDLTAGLAQSAQPRAPVREEAAAPAPRRSPGGARRGVASMLRRSADRLAPMLE